MRDAAQVEVTVETFEGMDTIGRVAVTNLKGEVVQTFPDARHEMFAESEELLVTPGIKEKDEILVDKFSVLLNPYPTEKAGAAAVFEQMGADMYLFPRFSRIVFKSTCRRVRS